MTKTQILDCTLRDGGYVNDFAFGNAAIRKIISKLTDAGVDIIETGFLEDGDYDPDCSVYQNVDQIADLLPKDHKKSMYVAMACYGEYNLEQLAQYDGNSIDGIRVTFHYNEVEPAIEYCRAIQKKGYKVFVQPVGTSSYTDEQLLSLIHEVNALHPYAFYLVDTLGLMQQDEVIRFFYLINHNLAKTIHMGFHSHNNLQLSFSNCQALASVESNRIISLDASVYGMGRGAGNLNTELIASYLNTHLNARYEIEPVLELIDEFISKIKDQFGWGYSVPYYLAAINGCHPNYASYLSAKNTLTVQNISSILHMIEPEKRSLFNKHLAEQKYLEFQANEVDDNEAIEKLRSRVLGKNILLLAPGSSLSSHQDSVLKCVKDNECVVIGVTFVPNFIECDFIFLSNLKRYQTTFNPTHKAINLIHTSNIKVEEESQLTVNYSSLLCDDDVIRDNSSLMLLNLLTKLSPKCIYIAGMDGYGISGANYYQDRLSVKNDIEQSHALNVSISKKLSQLRNQLKIEFITPTLYEK